VVLAPAGAGGTCSSGAERWSAVLLINCSP
jgi:hypothetical protein